MNIIFMGTPDFAVPALSKLIESEENKVVAVFSQMPKAKNRGMKITKSSVHILAEDNNIPVYTPKTLKTKESFSLIDYLKADIIVVVAYGFIIPKNILECKKYGCLNIHPSQLPKYRGAAPLQRVIINGDDETAMCIMQMDEGLDTGDIILREDFSLDFRITLQELHDKSANLGGDLLLEALKNIESLPRIKQLEIGATYAHKLSKIEGKVDWSNSSFSIDCKVRGMNPWPSVYFMFENKIIKIISANFSREKNNYQPGLLLNDSFDIACGTGVLRLNIIKPEGKGKMHAADFLKGNKNICILQTVFT